MNPMCSAAKALNPASMLPGAKNKLINPMAAITESDNRLINPAGALLKDKKKPAPTVAGGTMLTGPAVVDNTSLGAGKTLLGA
jgi:hypothetical protein